MAAGKMCYSTRVDLVLRKCVLNTSFSQWKYPCLQRTVYRCLMWHRSPSVSGITDNSPETNNTNARQKGHSSIKPIFTGPESSESKLLKVAIVGEANSGKSTLTNRLIGEKICAVTAIPHTTRRQTIGVFIVENCQIVLMDTPGMVTLAEGRRLKMTREHMLAPRAALEEADLIAVINDAADKRRSMRIHESILEYLKRHQHTPSILILNKVDNVNKKTILLSMANILLQDRKKDQWGYEDSGGWSKFEHVFMVSARTDDGITDLKQYFAARSKPGDWLYPAETFTDQSVTERINEIFREKLLELYPHEIPWQIRQVHPTEPSVTTE